MNQFKFKFFLMFALMTLIACQTIHVNQKKGNDTNKPWDGLYPYPYVLDDEFSDAIYNAEWEVITEQDHSYLREKAYSILNEWGMKMNIDPSSDLYLGEFEYQKVPYSYHFNKSKDGRFISIFVWPKIFDKVESFDGVETVSTVSVHPIEIYMTSDGYKVICIIRGP